MKKSNDGHQCTKQEADNLKKIIWKYFDKRVADNVLKSYGKKQGEPEVYGQPYCYSEKTTVKNRDKAKKEFFDYLNNNEIYGEDKFFNEDEMAIIYDSGFIYPGY